VLDSERRAEQLLEDGEDEVFIKKKKVKNWSKNSTAFTAFCQGKLRYNDYQIIISFILSIFFLAAMGLCLCVESESLWGVTVAVPFLHYGLAYIALTRHLSTDFPLAIWEIICFALSFIVQYGWGVVYFKAEYFDADALEADEADLQGKFLVIYLITIPFVTTLLSCFLKFMDDQGKPSIMFFILFALSIL
jgi:hypothetical protein